MPYRTAKLLIMLKTKENKIVNYTKYSTTDFRLNFSWILNNNKRTELLTYPPRRTLNQKYLILVAVVLWKIPLKFEHLIIVYLSGWTRLKSVVAAFSRRSLYDHLFCVESNWQVGMYVLYWSIDVYTVLHYPALLME